MFSVLRKWGEGESGDKSEKHTIVQDTITLNIISSAKVLLALHAARWCISCHQVANLISVFNLIPKIICIFNLGCFCLLPGDRLLFQFLLPISIGDSSFEFEIWTFDRKLGSMQMFGDSTYD